MELKRDILEAKRAILLVLALVCDYRKVLLKALFVPIVILVSLGFIPNEDPSSDVQFFNFVASGLFSIVIAVTTHRIILLGPNSVSKWGIYVPGKRELLFVAYSFGVGIVMVPLMLLTLIPVIGQVVGLLAIIYVMSRLSLVFPAIATDQDWSFRDSWRATEGHQILMMTTVALFPFLLSVPEQMLSYVPFAGILVNLISAFSMVFIISALSVAFRIVSDTAGES